VAAAPRHAKASNRLVECQQDVALAAHLFQS
jgi:hypothetical protein